MISNQYQNQPNFYGNLIKTGIKLPEKTFEETAKIYAKKTAGKPDLTLMGRRNQNELGRFYYSTDAIINGDDFATISTKSLKQMFENRSPKKIAEELVNLSRMADVNDKANILRKEINAARKNLINLRFQLEYVKNPESLQRLNTIIDNIETALAKKEKQYAKIKPANISGEWCI